MPEAAFVILYVIFSLLVGLCGVARRIGFFATFLLSILFTPVLVLLVLLVTAPARGYERDVPSGRN
jgi:hypothetical protein